MVADLAKSESVPAQVEKSSVCMTEETVKLPPRLAASGLATPRHERTSRQRHEASLVESAHRLFDSIRQQFETYSTIASFNQSGAYNREEWNQAYCRSGRALRAICHRIANADPLNEGKGSSYLYTHEYVTATSAFLDRLISYFSADEASNSRNSGTYKLAHGLRDALFSCSPDVASCLPIEDALILAARANRLPTLQGNIGASLVTLLVFSLRFRSDPALPEKLTDLLGRYGLPTQLDLVDQLTTIAADAVANGHWAERAIAVIEQVLKNYKLSSRSRLGQLVGELALNRVQEEIGDPSLSIYKFGDLHEGRLANKNIGDDEIERRVDLSDSAPQTSNLRRIAKDAIAAYDHSGYPKQIAFCDVETLPVPTGPSIKETARVEQAMHYLLRGPTEVNWIALMGKVFSKRWALPDQAPGPELELGINEIQRKALVRSLRISEKAERYNADAEENAQRDKRLALGSLTAAFVEYISREGPAAIAEHHDPHDRQLLEECLALMRMAKDTSEQFDYAYEFRSMILTGSLGASQLAKGASVDSSQSDLDGRGFPLSLAIVEETNRRIVTGNEIYNDNESFETHRYRTTKREQNAIDAGNVVLEQIFRNGQDPVARQIQCYLERLQEELRKVRPKLACRTIESLASDKHLNPFDSEGIAELTLLLRQLHYVPLRNKVEEELGVDLNRISLKSQIHFMRFLAMQDCDGYDRLRAVLLQHSGCADQILGAFLANAEDSQYAEAILRIGESMPTDTVNILLSKYIQISDRAEEIDLFIRKNCATTPDELKVGEITRNLLHRANELLLEWSKDEKFRTVDSSLRLTQALDQIDDEIILFGSVFKALKRVGVDSIADFRNTATLMLSGDELSENWASAMTEMSYGNTRQYPPKLAELFHTHLCHALHDPNERFFVFIASDKIAAFVRLSPKGDGSLYAGSFNARHGAKGFGIGEALFSATLERFNEQHKITALCWADTPALGRYLELGFEIVATDPNYQNTGATVHSIVMEPGNFSRPSRLFNQDSKDVLHVA